MQEHRFEFDASCGNDQWIPFSYNWLINGIFGSSLDLQWLLFSNIYYIDIQIKEFWQGIKQQA